MKNSFITNSLKVLCAVSVSLTAVLPVQADEEHAATTTTVTTKAAAPLALKSVWAKGLRQPQGMARDEQGNVYVAEYKGGQIAKFSPDGKLLAHLGTDLKSPAWIASAGGALYVSERKANRILKLHGDGSLVPLPGEVVEPLGLTVDNQGRLLVIAHTTSKVFALEPAVANATGSTSVAGAAGSKYIDYKFTPLYEVSGGKKYGYRCLAVDRDGSLLISDEVDGVIRLLTPNGRMTTWASGLDSPTAVVIAPDRHVYVLEEGAGRLVRLDAEGQPTMVADGLGQARDVEFTDAKTALVSDRESGTIYQLKLQ